MSFYYIKKSFLCFTHTQSRFRSLLSEFTTSWGNEPSKAFNRDNIELFCFEVVVLDMLNFFNSIIDLYISTVKKVKALDINIFNINSISKNFLFFHKETQGMPSQRLLYNHLCKSKSFLSHSFLYSEEFPERFSVFMYPDVEYLVASNIVWKLVYLFFLS